MLFPRYERVPKQNYFLYSYIKKKKKCIPFLSRLRTKGKTVATDRGPATQHPASLHPPATPGPGQLSSRLPLSSPKKSSSVSGPAFAQERPVQQLAGRQNTSQLAFR